MYQKVLCFAVFIAAVSASGHAPYSSVLVRKIDAHAKVIPVAYELSLGHGHEEEHGGHHGHHGHHHSIDYYTHPKYEFEYKVVDHHTGDIKAQHERREGDHVKGYYALNQPDGHERIVHYESDKHDGFRANVKYGTHHTKHYHH